MPLMSNPSEDFLKKDAIGVGLVGCGTVARYGHLPAIVECPGLRLIGVTDVSETSRKAVADQYAVECFASVEALLARPDIQAITLTTPLPAHYPLAMQALEAGKRVLCEKPFVETPAQARALHDLARERNLLVAVNFEYRVDRPTKLIKAALGAGNLGHLRVMRFIYNWSAHGITGPMAARRAEFLKSGGGCMDCGVHHLDLARYLSGSEFQSLNALGQWEDSFRYPSHILIQARMQSGVIVLIEESFLYTHASDKKTWFMQHELIGSQGIASWQADTPLLQMTSAHSHSELPGILQIISRTQNHVEMAGSDKPFSEVYHTWARCLREGTMEGSPLATALDGWRATEAMTQALESADNERAQFRAVP